MLKKKTKKLKGESLKEIENNHKAIKEILKVLKKYKFIK